MPDRIGDKWAVMVVGALSKGPVRFNALLRLIGGVSHRMLTLTLRGLEHDGLVKRTVHPSVPPKVEYELTEVGASLVKPLRALSEWAQRNQPGKIRYPQVIDVQWVTGWRREWAFFSSPSKSLRIPAVSRQALPVQ